VTTTTEARPRLDRGAFPAANAIADANVDDSDSVGVVDHVDE
jgi:hypothetical protein